MMAKTPVNTDEEIASLDPKDMTSTERVTFISDARLRRMAGEVLTKDHLRFAIRCIRSERTATATAAGLKKASPVVATSLSEF